MSNLKENFDAVRASIAALDSAFAEALNQLTADHEKKLDAVTRACNEELAKVREEAAEALQLYTKVQGFTVGILGTESLNNRLLFEKIAQRWADLSPVEIEMIEEVLDRKVVKV